MSMAVEDDEKSRFKAQFENLNLMDVATGVLFHKENLSMTFLLSRRARLYKEHTTSMFNMRMEDREKWSLSGKDVQQIDLKDLDGVKHYTHSDLGAFTHDLEQKCLIGKTMLGRLLNGKIQLTSGTKDVIIKTWDVVFPPDHIMELHPLRVCDEIMFLTNDFMKSHQNVPQLIGYSIDKTFAAVYDLQSKKTLRLMLESDYFGWDARLEVAVQVARMMNDFHNMEIIIGSIDPYNIMIDQENNIKLCEFGLRDHMHKAEAFSYACTGGGYTPYLPEISLGGKPTVKSDIYAFGCLLLELITKEPYRQVIDSEWEVSILLDWAGKQLDSGATSLVDKSLMDDEDVGSKISKLVANCLIFEPDQRWESKIVLEKLENLKQGRASKKPKVTTC